VTQYVLSEDADRDLDNIWDYIAEDNIDAADLASKQARQPGSPSGASGRERHGDSAQ